MNEYFIYALNTKDKIITAALSCPDYETAQLALLHARRELNISDKDFGYKFGITGTRPLDTDLFFFRESDLKVAELSTQEVLAKIKCIEDVSRLPVDVLFIGLANVKISEKKNNPITPSKDAIRSQRTTNGKVGKAKKQVSDCPRQIQAASGVGVPDIVEAYNASIEDSDGTPANVRDKDAIDAIKDLKATVIEIARQPQPVYFADNQRPYSPEDFSPSKGFWESVEKQAKRRKVKMSTLESYRETGRGAKSIGNGVMRDSQGVAFKQENGKTVYFVENK